MVSFVDWRVHTVGSRHFCSSGPCSMSSGESAWWSAVTPSLLNQLAMVPNTKWLQYSRW